MPPVAATHPAPEPTTPPPEPSVLRLAVVPEAKLLDRVRHELDGLIRARVAPHDVAILGLLGQGRSALYKLDRLGTRPVVRADADDAGSHVVADTFLRFKGLERPFVIVTELHHGPSMKYDTRMHIALTRATAGAIIVCTPEDLQADERLRSLAAT